VFTSRGRLNLRNARHRDERNPLDADCGCPVCARWTRAYLRHLLNAGDALAARLLSLHNLAYYMKLLRDAREAIATGSFAAFAARWRARTRKKASLTRAREERSPAPRRRRAGRRARSGRSAYREAAARFAPPRARGAARETDRRCAPRSCQGDAVDVERQDQIASACASTSRYSLASRCA